MSGFRGGNDALRAGKEDTGLERFLLFDVDGFHQPVFAQLADDRPGSVITQTSGVNAGGFEIMAESIHGQQRSITFGVPEVIIKLSACKLGTRSGFSRDKADVLAFHELMTQERKRYASEVGTSAEAGYDNIGIIAREFHLFLGFQTYDGLMKHDMVKHAAEGIFGVRVLHCLFDGFGYRHAETTACSRELRPHLAPYFGSIARRSEHLRAVRVHDGLTVRLLLIAYLYHVHFKGQAEMFSGHTQGTTPLTCACFGSKRSNALYFIEIGLRNSGIQLVRPDRAHAFVLEVYFCRGIKGFFQTGSPYQRRRPVYPVQVADLVGNFYPTFRRKFLFDKCFREYRLQLLGSNRFARLRVQRGQRLVGHVRQHVIPITGHFAFGKHNLFCGFHIMSVKNFRAIKVGKKAEKGAKKLRSTTAVHKLLIHCLNCSERICLTGLCCLLGRLLDCQLSPVITTFAANMMCQMQGTAIGASDQGRRNSNIMGPALSRPCFGLFSFRMCHVITILIVLFQFFQAFPPWIDTVRTGR